MNARQVRQLQAEQGALQAMLAQLSADRVIERASLAAREAWISEHLANVPPTFRDPLKAQLTFRGKPIVGTQGIFATFGAEALEAFSRAVTALGASYFGPLGARGALRNKEDVQLLVTGTAVGSFGFELEEAPSSVDQGQLLTEDVPTLVEIALKETHAILQASVASDDDLTAAVSDIDPRALEAIRLFLKTLSDNEAVCGLRIDHDLFQFSDVGQVKRSLDRLRTDNIHETTDSLVGRFLGVLPKKRTFELRVADGGFVILGKVGPGIEDAATINNVLDRDCRVVIKSRRVGSGTPRFTLSDFAPAD